MSAINRAALVSLLNSKVLTGGNQTTAQGVRDVLNGVIESLVDIIDDKDANGGYLGISASGIVDVTKIQSAAPLNYFLRDDGTWQPNAASTPTLQQVLTAGSTLTGANSIYGTGVLDVGNTDNLTYYNNIIFNTGDVTIASVINFVNTNTFVLTPTTAKVLSSFEGLSFIKTGGTSSQQLMANGSVRQKITESFTISGTTQLLSQTPLFSFGHYIDGQYARVGASGRILSIVGNLITFDQDYTGQFLDSVYEY